MMLWRFHILTQHRIEVKLGFSSFLFCLDDRYSLVGDFGPINTRHAIHPAFDVRTDNAHDNNNNNSCQIASNVTKQIETPHNGATKNSADSNIDDTAKNDDSTTTTATDTAETC
jgi:hypothetical protein